MDTMLFRWGSMKKEKNTSAGMKGHFKRQVLNRKTDRRNSAISIQN